MKVMLFEWLTGGGLWVDDEPLDVDSEMLRMGAAMIAAVAADFRRLVDVDLVCDSRVNRSRFSTSEGPEQPVGCIDFHPVSGAAELYRTLNRLAAEADAILIIAPETDGCLANLASRLKVFDAKRIGPTEPLLSLAADKNQLAKYLGEQGFDRIACGWPLEQFLGMPGHEQNQQFPVVLKLASGAGSEGVCFAEDSERLRELVAQQSRNWPDSKFRVERFIAGTPVSVGVIAGRRDPAAVSGTSECDPAASVVILKPLRQKFDAQPIGNYLSSVDDLDDWQVARASELVESLLPNLPPATGYFGIDAVISNTGPLDDAVIEVNPRITMSYICYRQHYKTNLAAELLARTDVA